MFNLTQFLETIRNLDLSLRKIFILTVIVIASLAIKFTFTKK